MGDEHLTVPELLSELKTDSDGRMIDEFKPGWVATGNR